MSMRCMQKRFIVCNGQWILYVKQIIIMGVGCSKQNEIRVATLNYAGIAYSPFEFYSGDTADIKQLETLSTIFKELAEKEKMNILNKLQVNELKIFDTTMQRQRYCPLYRQDVGIFHGRLMNRQDFCRKWREEYNKNKHYVKFKKEATKQQQDLCETYDYLTFKTFVEYIYNYKIEKRQDGRHKINYEDRTRSFQTRDQKIRMKAAVIQYQIFLEKHFDKSYLKHQTKLLAVKKLLQTKDVVFLQDASDELINSLKNQGKITIVTSPGTRDCAILLKKDNFVQLYDEQKVLKSFREQKDQKFKKYRQLFIKGLFEEQNPKDQQQRIPPTAFVDNFLFICLHLHSSEENRLKEYMKHLLELKRAFPDLTIVLGGDFNRFVGKLQPKGKQVSALQQEFYDNFSIYPEVNDSNNITTKKKRTWLQTQMKKADNADQFCRDFIITTVKPTSCTREVLGHRVTPNTRLLTDKHPFDHFIVSAAIPKQSRPQSY